MNIVHEDYRIVLHKYLNYYVILFKNYDRIEVYLSNIKYILKQNNYIGEVIFDLLLCNGKHNRLFIVNYDGKDFDKFIMVDSIDKKILILHNEYLQNNLRLLENSVLPKAQKFLIRKGRLI